MASPRRSDHTPRGPLAVVLRALEAPALHAIEPMARSPDASAVFHDRKALDEAVRALELEGVSRPRIHVYRVNSSGHVVHLPPERGPGLAIGAGVGTVAGVTLALFSVLVAVDRLPAWILVARLVVAAGAGALVGGLLAIVTNRLRTESRYEQPTGYKEFMVKVDAPDAAAAENVRDLLERAGGDPTMG